MKIVINKRFGGFGLSEEAQKLLPDGDDYRSNRIDPTLIQVVENLGSDKASGRFAKLKVVEIPDGVEYSIEEYDGKEWIAEKHRTWG